MSFDAFSEGSTSDTRGKSKKKKKEKREESQLYNSRCEQNIQTGIETHVHRKTNSRDAVAIQKKTREKRRAKRDGKQKESF